MLKYLLISPKTFSANLLDYPSYINSGIQAILRKAQSHRLNPEFRPTRMHMIFKYEVMT